VTNPSKGESCFCWGGIRRRIWGSELVQNKIIFFLFTNRFFSLW
jgi:hypothetical protein